MARVEQQFGRENLYQKTGIQFMPFNTLYQLRALSEQQPDIVNKAAHMLMIPDYFFYRLTGKLNWEYTNASTTQMLNLATGDWDEDLLKLAGVPRRWLQNPPSRVIRGECGKAPAAAACRYSASRRTILPARWLPPR